MLTIDPGVVLTDNGNFNVGGINNTTNATVYTGALTVNGGGSLAISGAGNFNAGQPSNNTGGKDTTTVDLTGLSSFSFNSTGIFGVGLGTNSKGILSLANTNNPNTNAPPTNFVNASEIDIGNSQNNNDGGASMLTLGLGSNTLQANTINIGIGKTGSTIEFPFDQPSNSLTVAGTGGGSAVANITIGQATAGTYTAGRVINLFLAGDTVNIQAGAVVLSQNTGNTANAPNVYMSLDTGTFGAQSINLASDIGGSSATGPTAELEFGGTASNHSNTSTAVMTIQNGLILGDQVNTGATTATVTATLNIWGGTVNISGGISVPSTQGTTNSTLMVTDNAVLNMNGSAIGGSGTNTGNDQITTVQLAPNGGDLVTLENLGGTGVNGAGLNVSPGGTLILDGNNTYTGGTTINGGTLQVGQASSGNLNSPLGAASGTVTNNATLNFASNHALTIANAITGGGPVNQNGNGVTTLTGTSNYTGQTTINAGTLAVEGALYNGVGTGTISINSTGNLAGGGTTNADVSINSNTASITPDANGTPLSVNSITDNGGNLVFDVNGARHERDRRHQLRQPQQRAIRLRRDLRPDAKQLHHPHRADAEQFAGVHAVQCRPHHLYPVAGHGRNVDHRFGNRQPGVAHLEQQSRRRQWHRLGRAGPAKLAELRLIRSVSLLSI